MKEDHPIFGRLAKSYDSKKEVYCRDCGFGPRAWGSGTLCSWCDMRRRISRSFKRLIGRAE